MFALRGREALKEAGITHVVSVLRLPLDKALFENYEHKVIEVDDVEDENLLEHFTSSNKFISEALKAEGAVLIHWFVVHFFFFFFSLLPSLHQPLASLLTHTLVPWGNPVQQLYLLHI